MKKRIVILVGLVLSLSLGNTTNAKSYVSEQDILQKNEFDGMYKTADGEVRFIKEEPDDSPRVCKWTGDGYENIKDPFCYFVWGVDEKHTTGYTSPSAAKSGKTFYAAKKTVLFKYNRYGNVKARYDLRRRIRGYKIQKVFWVKGDKVLLQIRKSSTKKRIILVDIRKKRVVKRYSSKYKSVKAVSGKYAFVVSGIIADGDEKIKKIVVSSGKVVKSLETKKLRKTASDLEDEDDKYGLLKNQSMTGAIYKGKLYVRYYGGLYLCDFKSSKFKKVETEKFKAGNFYVGTMMFDKSGDLYAMGYTEKSDYVTNLYLYK